MAGADVFIGVSGGTVPEEVVASMADDAIVFALANPTPRCCRRWPIGTPRSWRPVARDYPNQINNVLAFPGIFRGALDARATAITEGMKLAAAQALAAVGDAAEPRTIVPSAFDPRVGRRSPRRRRTRTPRADERRRVGRAARR